MYMKTQIHVITYKRIFFFVYLYVCRHMYRDMCIQLYVYTVLKVGGLHTSLKAMRDLNCRWATSLGGSTLLPINIIRIGDRG
jgi:hypothetical protein